MKVITPKQPSSSRVDVYCHIAFAPFAALRALFARGRMGSVTVVLAGGRAHVSYYVRGRRPRKGGEKCTSP